MLLAGPAYAVDVQPADAQPADAQPADAQSAGQPAGQPAEPAVEPNPGSGAVPADEEVARFDLILLGNIEGELAQVRCREELDEDDSFSYASQASLYFDRKAEAAACGALEPVALNTGDSIFPGALARYLLSKGEQGAAQLARLLAQIPYAAHAVGNHEFAPPRGEYRSFFAQACEAGLAVQAANLRCKEKGGAEAICDALGTGEGGRAFSLVERGPLTIGVTSVLDPEVVALLSRSRVEGLEIVEPRDALNGLIPRMREAGADLVVVLFHLASKQAGKKAEKLAGVVPGIDLIVTNGLFEPFELDHDIELTETRPSGYIVAPHTRTFLVGADTGSLRAVLASAEAKRAEGGRWQLVRFDPKTVPTSELPAHPETARMLEEVARAYCEDWGKPLRPGLELAQAFDLQDLRTFVLNVMRFETDSEIALANAQSFRGQQYFPLTDTLTSADVYATLPYGDRLATFVLKGSELAGLAKKLGEDLVAVGLEDSGNGLKVNGRPLNKDRTYRIATNQFLAEGGDGIFDPKKLERVTFFQPPWSESPPTIAAIVVRYVATGQHQRHGDDKLAPAESFPDLHSKFLWTYTGSINASYNRVAISNPQRNGAAAYDRARLNLTASDVVNTEAKAAARADSRNHGWDNDLLVLYAATRLNGGDAAAGFDETSDTIRLRSAYKFLGLRAASGDRWWVPVPFAELQVESEFNRPDERGWHLFELTGIVGTLFRIAGPLEIKVGFNGKRDIFQPGGVTTFGLNAGYQLKRFDVFKLLGKPVQFESELEYFFNSIGGANIHELRSLSRVFFALTNRLFFTASYNTYLFRTAEIGVPGHSNEVNVGLNFLWDKTVQSF